MGDISICLFKHSFIYMIFSLSIILVSFIFITVLLSSLMLLVMVLFYDHCDYY